MGINLEIVGCDFHNRLLDKLIVNGPENISKYLRVPMPDRPVLGILRISPPKARELSLNPDQIIRGIVSEDGKSVEFLLGNIKQEIRFNLEQWKGKEVEFKVNIDKNGSESSGEKARVSSEASLYQEPKHLQRYALHPKSLITLLANPNYSWLTFLNKIHFNSLITWMNNLYPSFTATTFPSLVYSAKKIDTLEIKKQLKNNGFKFIPKNIAIPESESRATLKHMLSILLKNLEGKADPVDINLKVDDFKGFIEYLDANQIEYVLKKENHELGIRFILLFTDFPVTEIFIEGKSANPKNSSAFKYSVEINLSFNEDNNIWSRIELIGDRALAIECLISESQTFKLANMKKSHLFELFQSAGIDLMRCDIREGKYVGKDRKETLKERGNLELSA